MMFSLAAARTRSSAGSVRWQQNHRITELNKERSFLFGGTHRGERVPSCASSYPLKGSFCDSVLLWQAHRCLDAGQSLTGRANIELKNPSISHQTLKPGRYGARKPFMRLP
jgi:hypothetical protein